MIDALLAMPSTNSLWPNTVVQWKNLGTGGEESSPYSLRCDFTERSETFVVTLYHLKLSIMVDVKTILEKHFSPM